MKKIISLLAFLLVICNVNAQKVGLVLSGGGAKGMTHIGIIRALEENNIPIDYIAGTSMGAIVGSLYAMGYSPDDMEALITSDDFARWTTGEIGEKYVYYFKKNRPTPEFVNVRISLSDSSKIEKPSFLPTSVVNPIQMNLAFLQLFSQANAYSGGNFDKLFVPFRCVASDVYNKKQLVLKEGRLGDAVRASMSFPLMFKPIKIDSVLVYDGGIYNNFPTDVMRKDFNPDIIIGSVVSGNPEKPKENDIMGQLENMIMQKTDYTIDPEEGILMRFKYQDVSLMDFHKLRKLHDIGYNRTMELMDSIKTRISRRKSLETVNQKRLEFRSNLPKLYFKSVKINGANELQEEYIRKELFIDDEEKPISFEEFKVAYFRLLSDDAISEIMPHAVYDKEKKVFNLVMNVKMSSNFSVRLGGNVSSSNSNQVYFGATYQNLGSYSREFSFDGQVGKVYNNAQLMAKFDFPTKIPMSYRFLLSFSSFDYFKKEKLFSGYQKPAFNSKDEYFAKLKFALPFMSTKRAEFGLGLASLQDKYFQSSVIDINKDNFDKSTYRLLGGFISFNGSTLNARQYATRGVKEALIAQIFTGMERFKPGDESMNQNTKNEQVSWIQLSYEREKYNNIAKDITLGWYVKALYSSRNFSENYTATMLQANEFAPTPHSRITYNESFRANQYLAFGVKPIYQINKLFHIRGEFYSFLPIFSINRDEYNKAKYGDALSKIEFISELSVVCQLPFGSISAYLNHYSEPKHNWNFGITLGWQLFNYRFIE